MADLSVSSSVGLTDYEAKSCPKCGSGTAVKLGIRSVHSEFYECLSCGYSFELYNEGGLK